MSTSRLWRLPAGIVADRAALIKQPLSRIAETDGVVPPEGLGVDQRPCHPRLVGGEPERLEGGVRDAQRRLSEALPSARLEAEARVVPRRPFHEHERDGSR